MPTYQYECSECGHSLEVLQTMVEPRLKTCPECHKDGLIRLIGTGSGIIFKGTGFYETDYKKKEVPKPSEGSSGDSKPTKKEGSESPKETPSSS